MERELLVKVVCDFQEQLRPAVLPPAVAATRAAAAEALSELQSGSLMAEVGQLRSIEESNTRRA